MFEICFNYDGQLHCFPIPSLIPDWSKIKGPPPGNFPELDLAVTILMLSEVTGKSEFTEKIAQLAHEHITHIQTGLPEGTLIRKNKKTSTDDRNMDFGFRPNINIVEHQSGFDNFDRKAETQEFETNGNHRFSFNDQKDVPQKSLADRITINNCKKKD
jgi:hypothetical protein